MMFPTTSYPLSSGTAQNLPGYYPYNFMQWACFHVLNGRTLGKLCLQLKIRSYTIHHQIMCVLLHFF